MARLEVALDIVEREINARKKERLWIEHKAYNDVYEAHEFDFNHCLRQVLFHYEAPDESIFDINKDV